ncbi:MAG: ABC transporter ATP-binding protein [Nitrososphaerales archaeon]|jgi:ABC-2 type transport system ATP-binding protein
MKGILLEASDIAIESVGLSKTYGKSATPALSDVSVTIPRSKIFTLLGKNGAGKTTFLRIAATQLKPTSGKITVLGFDAVTEAGRVRERIAAVPQEMRPFQALTPYDHVMMSLTSRGWSWKDAKPKARRTLEELGLGSYEDKSTDDLSGGLRQRTLVAMALATDVDLLFLDEPTIGLDPIARREVWKFIVELKHRGKTIFLTTHYLDEAEAISDRIAIISKGRLLKVGSVQELKSSIAENVRVDVSSGFSEEELKRYGKVSRIGEILRVLTDEKNANDLVSLSIGRHATVNVSPISLDDVFVDLLGVEEEEKPSW